MEWNGEEWMARAERIYGKRVQAAALRLQSRVRENISIGGREVTLKWAKKSGKMRRELGPVGHWRSLPGEFPRRQTGALMQSIYRGYNPETVTAIVGTRVKYGKFLEFGTAKMRPRPWLRRTLDDDRDHIVQIIETGTIGAGTGMEDVT